VVLTPTRIGIELMQQSSGIGVLPVGIPPATGETPVSPTPIPSVVRLEWEDEAGWLVASVREPGWLQSLSEEQRQAATTALAGLYKLAGIDLVREQVRENLPPPATSFMLTTRDLIVEVGPHQEPAIRYDLTRPRGPLKPRTLDGAPAPDWPLLDPARVIFARVPLSWQQWVESWQGSPDGKTPRTLFTTAVKLLPAASVG
jgi:hypothetical protein